MEFILNRYFLLCSRREEITIDFVFRLASCPLCVYVGLFLDVYKKVRPNWLGERNKCVVRTIVFFLSTFCMCDSFALYWVEWKYYDIMFDRFERMFTLHVLTNGYETALFTFSTNFSECVRDVRSVSMRHTRALFVSLEFNCIDDSFYFLILSLAMQCFPLTINQFRSNSMNFE